MNSKHSVAVVTGAAGGIGQCLAHELARRDYAVAMVDVDVAGLESIEHQLQAGGASCLAIAGDLADLGFVETIVPAVLKHWQRLDLLINNAAWRQLVSMREITPASWQRTLDVSLTAPAFLARWAATAMADQGGGVVANVSSIMAHRGSTISPAYVAAKAGLDGLTYELAAQYGRDGIRVFGVAPGAVDSAASHDYADASGQSVVEAMRSWSEEHIPLGRWAQPEEIARTVVHLCDPDQSYLHGTIVTLDGGWTHGHFPISLRRRWEQES